jgi:hypothetical protein
MSAAVPAEPKITLNGQALDSSSTEAATGEGISSADALTADGQGAPKERRMSRSLLEGRQSRRSSAAQGTEKEGQDIAKKTLPQKLELDEQRQLYYYVNEQGERVYQIPVRAMQPAREAET